MSNSCLVQVYLDGDKYDTVTDDFSMVIPNLEEQTQYVVGVTASTSAGEGDTTSVQVLTADRKCIDSVSNMRANFCNTHTYLQIVSCYLRLSLFHVTTYMANYLLDCSR